jgi:hypothetical protein
VIVLGLLKFGSFIGSIFGFRALPQETEPTPATTSDDDLSIIACGRFSNKLDGETFEDGRPEERLEDTASGQGYPYTLPDSSLPQTSPRIGRGVSVKQEVGCRPPNQMNNQIWNAQVQKARRMNCVGSSAASNSQPIMNHGAPRPSAPQYYPGLLLDNILNRWSLFLEPWKSCRCMHQGKQCVLECLSSMIPTPVSAYLLLNH